MNTLNKKVVLIGGMTAVMWAGITAISRGLSFEICQIIDHLTFHLFSSEVFKMANGFYYEVDNNQMPTVIFLFLFFVCFLMSIYLITQIEKHKGNVYTLYWIFGFAILFRLLLVSAQPIHENDFYRYLCGY